MTTTAPSPRPLIGPLSGRRAVVTGASSGIGEATARRLAADGAQVAVLGRRADRVGAVATDVGGVAVPADVTDGLDVAAAAVRSGIGPVDLVVANAGLMLAAPFATAEVAEWSAMLDTNLRALIDTARAFVDDLTDAASGGRTADLVLLGSLAADTVFPGYAVYSATKAAVATLGRGLRAELGPQGVRVRVVVPGLTDTDLGAGMADADARAFLARFRSTLAGIPAADVAEAIAWSCALPARVNVAELVVLPTAQG